MPVLLVIAEHEHGAFKKTAFELLGKATALGGTVVAGVVEPIDTSDGIGANRAPASPVTHRTRADRYIFKWKTEPSLANTCRALVVQIHL